MDDHIDILLSQEPLNVEGNYNYVQNDGAGGNVLFVGTVRNQTKDKPVSKLEFEAYDPMAVKEMRKIAFTMKQRWKATKITMHHRTGTLMHGDIAVIIAVSAPHRQAAFDACQYGIDTLKETVPIWKKEFFDDGEVWVAAHP